MAYSVCRALLAFLAAGAALAADPPSRVKIVRTAGGAFQLRRNGQPYFILGGGQNPPSLRAAGGNSVRGGGSAENLDRLYAAGLTVQYGLPLGKPRQGFDYSDPRNVASQMANDLAIVNRLKDHPALLTWALGNEPELSATEEQRIRLWSAIEELARAIHKADPNHPVITVLAGPGKLAEVKRYCPSLDAIGINAYGSMLQLPEAIAAGKWDKPYIVTEFGPRGHWEVAKTPWGLPLEDSSTEKADFYLKAYQYAVEGQPQSLGSYVFLWGHKQEKTHTWYGMFLPDGSPTAAVDVMTYVWTGQWPSNRAPRTGPGKFQVATESGVAIEDHVFRPGTRLLCTVTASDPEGDPLTIQWDLRPDVSDNPNGGGDPEPASVPLEGAVVSAKDNHALIAVPLQPGNYRIFVYARDPGGKAATANVPIRVQE